MKAIFLGFIVLICSATVFAQDPVKRKEQFNLRKDGLAIQGYDPVAYFTQRRAVKGSPAYSFSFKNVLYHFSSPATLKAFKTTPERYEPEYGGWCAYAMGDSGDKVEIDPETFKIIDGKLYLFYHTFFNNTLTKWNKDETSLHRKADMNWTKIAGAL
ncbi:YHS domain-containing (seleno)protein [Arsenicibacter rosenii]|uniref:YHS domain protein n=1 Tax=Arsenicibacter rosenii TaxID=1750698 RepID=A0A1S2VFH6_9BACT|nr:YHS domain-containing (seleno)protein [Arsenicibacter rosenii]OIN57501.1 YHS domain protein [Arsenicibacter rosenii]